VQSADWKIDMKELRSALESKKVKMIWINASPPPSSYVARTDSSC
jgi:hypothetical protein